MMNGDQGKHPVCRRAILKFGLVPFLENGLWLGRKAARPDGWPMPLSDSLRRAMRQMIEEGVFGPVRIGRRNSRRRG